MAFLWRRRWLYTRLPSSGAIPSRLPVVDLARRWPRVTSVTLSTQIHKGSSYATQEPAPNYRHTGNPNLSCRSTPRSRVPTLLRLDRRRGPVDLYSGRSRSRPRRPCSHLHADGDQQRPGRRHRRNDHRRPAGRCNLRVGNVHRRQVRRVLGRRDVLRGRSRHRRDGHHHRRRHSHRYGRDHQYGLRIWRRARSRLDQQHRHLSDDCRRRRGPFDLQGRRSRSRARRRCSHLYSRGDQRRTVDLHAVALTDALPSERRLPAPSS